MNRVLRVTASSLVACLFPCVLYCVNGNLVDTGGGIDIGNPIKVCVVDSLKRPVSHATVKLISADAWLGNVFNGSEVITDSAVTDNSGMARFYSLAPHSYNCQIDHCSRGAFVRNIGNTNSRSIDTVTIKEYGIIAGTYSSVSSVPSLIRLEGTSYRTTIGTNGTFAFLGVPEGECLPLIMDVDYRWTLGATINVVSSNVSICSDEVSFTTLLIEDFEDSSATKDMARYVKNSHLYTAHIALNGASAVYRIVPEGINGGNALRGTLITRGGWALLGYYLGDKGAGDSLWDFSSSTGLSFNAKGKGTLNVSFESDTIDKMGNYKHYSADILLQEQWRKVCISFDTLKFKHDANPDPDISWKASARSIKRIEFNALDNDTVELWIDDLQVEGVDFSAVY